MLEKEAKRNLEELEIGAMNASEIEEALDVTARSMRDNPLTVAAFGDDSERRRQRFRRFMGGAAKVLGRGPNMLVVRGADGTIAGVCNMMPPGDCQPSTSQQLRMLPSLLANGPRAAGRTMSWLGVWSKSDPKERHWHLGPLTVDVHLQGMGIGSKLMRVFSARADAAGEDVYLETDKLINVPFYERFGFGAVSEQEVLGVPNCFMLRRAEKRS